MDRNRRIKYSSATSCVELIEFARLTIDQRITGARNFEACDEDHNHDPFRVSGLKKDIAVDLKAVALGARGILIETCCNVVGLFNTT